MTPTCRYLSDAAHVCSNAYGQPLREHQTCRAEAAAQLQTLLAAHTRADADLARQEAMACASDARLTACEHWHEELS